jgi:hypothetical protein
MELRELTPPEGKFYQCELCYNEAIEMDTYCEEHQRCFDCGEREVCNEDCLYQPLIEQYNRNRPYKDFIYHVNQIK